jgi:hypothetical protein
MVLQVGCWTGCAIAQAVSRWLPTAADRVRARVWSCGIYGGQSGTRAGFLRVLRFPLPIFIPPVPPQSPSSIIRGWYNRPVVATVGSGLSLTPLIIIITTIIIIIIIGCWMHGWWPCCVKNIVAEFRVVKTGWSNSRQIWQNLLRKAVAQKGLFCHWSYQWLYPCSLCRSSHRSANI